MSNEQRDKIVLNFEKNFIEANTMLQMVKTKFEDISDPGNDKYFDTIETIEEKLNAMNQAVIKLSIN